MFIGVNAKEVALTGAPQLAKIRFTPIALRKVVLPDMFEPVINRIVPSFSKAMSLPTRVVLGINGWPKLWLARPTAGAGVGQA